MRADEPSRTARGVALRRSLLDRPSSPTGDPAAEARLEADLIGDARELASSGGGHGAGAGAWIAARTPFFDEAVLRAITDGTRQIVVLGAGYDGRALRFRTPGVRFFEVDHPATQADKRRRLAALAIDAADIAFVGADLTESGLGDRLAAVGHDANAASLFVLEGVLRYLPEPAYRALLATLADLAGPGSELAVTVSTAETAVARDGEREQRLAAGGEAVLTVPPREVALRWVTEAGWSLVSVTDTVSPEEHATGLGRLLARATPAAR